MGNSKPFALIVSGGRMIAILWVQRGDTLEHLMDSAMSVGGHVGNLAGDLPPTTVRYLPLGGISLDQFRAHAQQNLYRLMAQGLIGDPETFEDNLPALDAQTQYGAGPVPEDFDLMAALDPARIFAEEGDATAPEREPINLCGPGPFGLIKAPFID